MEGFDVATFKPHPKKLVVRSKIWIEDENGDVVFGSGRLRILNAVEEHGSILAASKQLNMSYRAVWGKIKATEERLGQPLLSRKAGGARGGGSELTPLGKALVERFRQLQKLTETAADNLFQDIFIDGLDYKTF
ncbi:MAG: LysR family transcriptional regulator [Deltaproteobacteria bacterium]|jgi:molybdate transport system regulatory protein|uniref:ModE family transcriptional regulator n=1 Tax=Desulforhabdus amnigena TaxID=40218 RepID=A0A9W6FS35_9BACT|nr:LysR family transcriptional regulator [Deltaproteobacteria bacterium]GLI34172.1 ModE family transcriptional regulator [Desulforhabdus amnigena]